MEFGTPGSGLTTTKTPWLEQANENGEFYLPRQPYECYSQANHDTWRRLYLRQMPRWRQFAVPEFLEGVTALNLQPDQVPNFGDINRFLEPLTGFQAKGVSGYVPAFLFFQCLRNREFPTTVTVRDGKKLGYLPEPDMFHDIAGHVPMHTNRRFADNLVQFGKVAQRAAKRSQSEFRGDEQIDVVASNIKALARVFWFTVEFGLMESDRDGRLKVYGSGLLSSHAEIRHSIVSPQVQRFPLDLRWVINQYFEIHHFQPLLFFVENFDHLFEQLAVLARWLEEGRLDNVSPGEPDVREEDIKSFLEAV
ncbi:MAG: phenylalanine 4-monooxygenase [Candidatus Berkelbacteria bacterium]|nr:MAG: phenylalanine 4-monooxygenase [Candidatus Berkelbacteria bacterium]QQG51780.1 MAG: phenylalanine 4-monooxygenase [Candidatus Berkelbacteria bacterium]